MSELSDKLEDLASLVGGEVPGVPDELKAWAAEVNAQIEALQAAVDALTP